MLNVLSCVLLAECGRLVGDSLHILASFIKTSKTDGVSLKKWDVEFKYLILVTQQPLNLSLFPTPSHRPLQNVSSYIPP